MVLEMSDNFINETSPSNNLLTASYDEEVYSMGSGDPSTPALVTTIIFGAGVLFTSSGLLIIFLKHRGTAKHASLIMISTLANLAAGSFCDLVFRAPFFAIGEYGFAKIHPKICVVFILIPDYFMIAIILCLPLLSIERLLRLETKEHLTTRQTRHLFLCLLVVAYSLAVVVSILPATNLFAPGVNARCESNLVYGHGFSYVYSALTLVSVILTAVFSIAVVFRLKFRLKHLRTTMRKKIVLKQGTVSAISITGVLFLALVPFAASLQLVLMCGSGEIEDGNYCTNVISDIIFRTCIVLQKLCLVALPLIFLALNPSLRRKVWLTLKKPKKMENVVTISSTSMTVSKDSICDEMSGYMDDGDDGDFITIAEDLAFGKCGDLKGEVKRRNSVRHRQSVLDLVEVLSVISERSESSRSYSISCSEEPTSQ